MPPKDTASFTTPSPAQVKRWKRMLSNRLPLIGPLVQIRSQRQLTLAAENGHQESAIILLDCLINTSLDEQKNELQNWIESLKNQSVIDTAWGYWSQNERPAILFQSLQKIGKPASKPPVLQQLSKIKLNLDRPIENSTPDQVLALIELLQDQDTNVAHLAKSGLENLKTQSAKDAFGEYWRENRTTILTSILRNGKYQALSPAEALVYTALKLENVDIILSGGTEIVRPLILACQDMDSEIQVLARQCIHNLTNRKAINEICKLWLETRSPFLDQILVECEYLPAQPFRTRIACALRLGKLELIHQSPPNSILFLLQFALDVQSEIREAAIQVLKTLQKAEQIDQLCDQLILNDHQLAKQIALECNYLPSTPARQALFFMLTGQYEKYACLDFDQRLLRVIYDTSTEDLRQKIARQIQQSGRVDFLSVMAGMDYQARAGDLTEDEIKILINMLVERKEWGKIWVLTRELPLSWSIKLLRVLSQAGWKPDTTEEHDLFQQLVELISQPIASEPEEIQKSIPPAVYRSWLNSSGRINDIAFSPNHSQVAIACSNKKIIIWDFHEAKISHEIRDFSHSVGLVEYMPDGTLIGAERTVNDAECKIIAWDGIKCVKVGEHQGSIAKIIPTKNYGLLSAGKDQQLKRWDLVNKNPISNAHLIDWPRAASVNPAESHLLLLDQRVKMVSLPELQYIQVQSRNRSGKIPIYDSVASEVLALPDNQHFLLGQNNGQVILYKAEKKENQWGKTAIFAHRDRIQGIEFHHSSQRIITAGNEGYLSFTAWPDITDQKIIQQPKGKVTALKISPDGQFMATGSSEDGLFLWDLRMDQIPALFYQPLAKTRPNHLAAVNSLLENPALPAAIMNALRYLSIILQHHFRFEIQIVDLPGIQPGSFDIIID